MHASSRFLLLFFFSSSFGCTNRIARQQQELALQRATDSTRIADSIYHFFVAPEKARVKQDSITSSIRKPAVPEPVVTDSLHLRYLQTLNKLFDRSRSQPCNMLTHENGVNVFRMNNASLIHEYIGYHLPLHDLDVDHPYYECSNTAGTEILRFVFHEGGSYDFFDEMEVRPAKGETADTTLEDAAFISTEGIHLGMNRSLVIAKTGDCFVSAGPAGNDSLVYTTKDDELYFRYYVFRDNQLIYFRFGNSYP